MKITASWFKRNSSWSAVRRWTLSHYPDGVQASELIKTLWDEYRSWAAWIVVRWPDAPKALVERLAGDADWRVRVIIAQRPRLSAALVKQLAGDTEWEVRIIIAERPRLSATLVKRLAEDTEWDVREAIARRS